MRGKSWWLGGALASLAVAASAQEWGQVGVGYAWLNGDGNRDAYASQYDLSNGLFLDTLRLDLHSFFPGVSRFEVSASGFGAEPFARASVRAEWDREWSLRLDYTRRRGAFAPLFVGLSAASGFVPAQWRSDEFAITRWTGSLAYDGWDFGRLRLDLRDVSRSGSQTFAFYGLGLPYVARNSLDDRESEAGISLETRHWPVHLLLEQDVAWYTRKSRGSVADGGQPLNTDDQYLLSQFTTPGKDSGTVPTTRLGVNYRDDRFELIGQGIYRRDRFDADRNDTTGWHLVGGAGDTSFIDALTGKADTDTKLGDLRLGWAATPALTLRVVGHYQDSSSDLGVVGNQILRIVAGGGTFDFPLPVADQGFLDRTDKDVAGEVDLHQGPFGLVVSYHDGSQQADWQHGLAYQGENVTRDAKGWNATASVALGRTLTAQVGWQDQSFEHYVFLTDPETVSRVWAKVTTRPVAGLELSAYANHDRADNPSSEASLRQPADGAGISGTYTAPSGAFVNLNLDLFKLTSSADITFFAPLLTSGVSRYDTDLLTAGVRGGLPIGKTLRIEAGALQVKDRGDSLPFTSHAYDARLEMAGPLQFDFGVFANYWKYDLKNSGDQDYNVTRYGISVRRRF
ncbi:MAG TPA: hypothetical protein VLW17_13840 [Thermoanaerobaculaceae bacterium]|nr:hypothetical protein [Thermoanaerobaculaceae bacterium]